jgi:hypothetical protein
LVKTCVFHVLQKYWYSSQHSKNGSGKRGQNATKSLLVTDFILELLKELLLFSAGSGLIEMFPQENN